MDIGVWLRELGLERYADAFEANAIDHEVLSELTEADLEKLGVLLGHRKKLLKAIADLCARAGDAAPASGAEGAPRTDRATGAERRQLTVLFCDLVGSTALAAQLDPEDMGEVIRSYQERCGEVVSRWEGHVAKYMGDGVLTYFGWPQAHEDDPERAVRAGLDLAKEVGRLTTTDGAPLGARVGIATGVVMVGDLVGEGAAQEQRVIGETPNLAARLQALAEPGSVVIAEGTRRLLGGLFDYVGLGPRELKGFAAPVRAWRVVGESRVESRFEALHGQQLTGLVGREHEIGLLVERWERAKEGEGQVVLLSGEPGIGKSRIVRALRERLAGEPHTPLSHYCSPHHTNSALYPVLGLLERAAGFTRDDTTEARLDKLEALLGGGTEALGEAVPLVADLLGIETGQRYPAPALSPQGQKQRTLEVLVDQVEGLAARQPVLAVYEDAHWIDPTTLEALDLLIERVQRLPVLVLITFRPEFSPPWTGHAHVMQLSLSRLTRRHGQALVAAVTGGKALPDEVLDQILAKTDGVPLFVEELTKAVVESGLLTDAGDHYALTGPLAPLAIPATLHDSLMARLDRLAPVKEVAQIGAVIGREFSYELLTAVVALEGNELEDALAQLVASELIFRRGVPPNSTYSFKHALVQDAAYQSLLKVNRQRYHQRIAQVLETRFPQTANTEPEVLARHYSEAGLTDQAIHYWHRAGQFAAQRSANVEAVAHCERGLELLSKLPETTERHERELELQMAIGPALVAARGFADPGVGNAYARAWELCHRLGDKVHLPVVLRGRQVFHRIRGELSKARDFAEQLLALAELQQDSALLVGGCHALGQDLFQMGELVDAQRIVERGIGLFDPEQHRLRNWPGGQPGEQCYLYGAFVLWMLGYPDQGLRRGEEALALANNLSNAANLINTLAFVALVHVFRREPAAARQRAQATTEMSAEQRNPFFLAWGTVLQGWAQAAQQQLEDGIAEIDRGMATYRATGSQTWLPYFLSLQADAYLRARRLDDGLALVTEALALCDKTGERCWQAELNRLKGELLLAVSSSDHAEAEDCFSQSLGIARNQKARSWELRAATSLARLWRDQGKRARARDLLAPIYGWFTEGFDTADLREAKALLAELA